MVKKKYVRKRPSVIWQIPIEDLKQETTNATSLGQILKHHGLINKGRNSSTLKRRLLEERIDFSHLKMGRNSNKGREFQKLKLTLQECLENVFIQNSTYNRISAKRYILRYNLMPYECVECKLKGEWNGKSLVLQIDHKDGVSNNHILDNLQWICPNCHSQTPTFSGRRKKYLLW
jgi:5-methylcytosine-specific restriction endonuclease McrA